MTTMDASSLPLDLRMVLDLPAPSVERLRSLFDLTSAEARIAQRLARGDSVEEAAQRLNIKMTTARTQLAAVFAKTNTRRQAVLVAILSRIAHLDQSSRPHASQAVPAAGSTVARCRRDPRFS